MEFDTRWYMWFHPLLQLCVTVIGFIALYWGWKRFQMKHLKKRVMFPWKKHVFWGTVALAIWILGLGLGLAFAQLGWGSMLITEIHYIVAFAMAPLCIIGYVTGYILDKYKKKRTVLPIVHAVNNIVLCVLASVQVYTGVMVIRLFMAY